MSRSRTARRKQPRLLMPIDALEPRRLLSIDYAINYYAGGPIEPLNGATATWDRDPNVPTRGNGSYTLTLGNLPPHAEAQIDVWTNGTFDPNEETDPGSDFITHVIVDESFTYNLREATQWRTT